MEGSASRWVALVAFGLLSTLPQTMSAAEPCKLLTVPEIGQVLGVSVSPTPVGTTGCLWTGSSQRVSITLRDATAWARITAIAPGSKIIKTNMSGLGDAAQYSGMQDTWTLSVKQGAGVIVLTVYGVTGERQRSVEESLARLALRRL
jgi:hypothetical protein